MLTAAGDRGVFPLGARRKKFPARGGFLGVNEDGSLLGPLLLPISHTGRFLCELGIGPVSCSGRISSRGLSSSFVSSRDVTPFFFPRHDTVSWKLIFTLCDGGIGLSLRMSSPRSVKPCLESFSPNCSANSSLIFGHVWWP